jgi:hypothetical protein
MRWLAAKIPATMWKRQTPVTDGAMLVPKFDAQVPVGKTANKPPPQQADENQQLRDGATTHADEPDVVTTITTIGVIGVAAALFDVALIPGMIIGVAAAYAPKYVTNVGERLQPLFNYTVRGAYKMTRSARHAVAEAQERMHDIAAEVAAEEAVEADGEIPAAAAHAVSEA